MSRKTFTNFYLLIVLAGLCLCSTSCSKDDPNYLFEVSHGFDIEIPAGQNTILDLVIPFENLRSEVARELTSRGLSADDISIIQTARARIDLTGFDGNLGDFRSVVTNVYLGPDPIVNPFEAGYTIEIRDRFTDRIDIVPSLTNLKEVLISDIFNMELEFKWRRISAVPIRARFTINFGAIQ